MSATSLLAQPMRWEWIKPVPDEYQYLRIASSMYRVVEWRQFSRLLSTDLHVGFDLVTSTGNVLRFRRYADGRLTFQGDAPSFHPRAAYVERIGEVLRVALESLNPKNGECHATTNTTPDHAAAPELIAAGCAEPAVHREPESTACPDVT